MQKVVRTCAGEVGATSSMCADSPTRVVGKECVSDREECSDRAKSHTPRPPKVPFDILDRGEDAVEAFHERAAILEYDAGLTREQAEARAAAWARAQR